MTFKSPIFEMSIVLIRFRSFILFTVFKQSLFFTFLAPQILPLDIQYFSSPVTPLNQRYVQDWVSYGYFIYHSEKPRRYVRRHVRNVPVSDSKFCSFKSKLKIFFLRSFSCQPSRKNHEYPRTLSKSKEQEQHE
jgi:hypothetical protein